MFDSLWWLHWHVQQGCRYPGVHRTLVELGRENSLVAAEWRELRIRRMRRLLSFANENVTFYSKCFADAGFHPATARLPDDLRRLPLLTKDVIRNSIEDLIAKTADRSKLVKNASGGSTGTPLVFFQDATYHRTAAAIDSFVRAWWGVRPFDRTAVIWGTDRDFQDLSWRDRFYEWRSRTRYLNAFRMTARELAEFAELLTRWRPPYMTGYASALEELAKAVLHHGQDGLQFKVIRSAAETLSLQQRRLIQEAFRSPVCNFYGSREVNNLASECPEERQLHLLSTWRYVEVVDEQGRPLPDGTTGQIAVTDLSNFGMPFIRYLNGDAGSIGKAGCPCGRPSPVIDNLLGRTSDLIRTRDGEVIHGEFFTHLFYGRNDISEFQLHQKSLDLLVLRYVPARFDKLDRPLEEIAEKIRKAMGGTVRLDMQRCREIPVTPSGKRRFTISDVPGLDDSTPRQSGEQTC